MVTLGIDEVGRGCWAGPLVAGAVILKRPIKGLKDSKLLSKLQRDKLVAEIQIQAIATGLGWVTATEIDSLGLTEAVRLAMLRAIDQIKCDYNEIIIDGNHNYFTGNPKARALIGADNLVPAVSAASVIAKVARDKFMCEQSIEFPEYFFEKHVGYGTKLHQEALKLHGICTLHRQSFKPIRGSYI